MKLVNHIEGLIELRIVEQSCGLREPISSNRNTGPVSQVASASFSGHRLDRLFPDTVIARVDFEYI